MKLLNLRTASLSGNDRVFNVSSDRGFSLKLLGFNVEELKMAVTESRGHGDLGTG
jgi:hypothetical protein